MKKHLLVARLGRDAKWKDEPLCGRQIARPGVGQQVVPVGLTADSGDVRCGWCLQKMQEQGQELTAGQRPLVARKSVPGPRAEAEAEAEDQEEEDA